MRSLLLWGLLTASSSSAQSWVATYPTVGDDLIWKGVEASDGTLVTLGHSTTEGSLVSRLSPAGLVLWSRALPDSFQVLRDCALSANGDILVCGNSGGDGVVMRLDAAGNILWQVTEPYIYFGGEDSVSHVFTAVAEAAGGDILLAGQRNPDPCGGPSKIQVRLDSQGNKLWGARGGIGWFSDLQELPDGSVAFVGVGFPTGVEFVRAASDGTKLATRQIGLLYGDRGKLDLAADGSLFVVPGCYACNGYYFSSVEIHGFRGPQNPFELAKVDPDGHQLWRKAYGDAPDSAIDVVATPDGGALVLGETFRFGGDRDLRLIRVDAAGDLVWQRAYGGTGDESALSLTALAGGDFLVTGRTNSPPSLNFDGLLMRVDGAGEVQGCPTTETWRVPLDLPDISVDARFDTWDLDDRAEPSLLSFVPASLSGTPRCLGIAPVGAAYCAPAIPNSSGSPAVLHSLGSLDLAENDLTLVATGAPVGTFGYFVAGMGTGQSIPAGSQGRLCLGGAPISRITAAIQATDAAGSLTHVMDLGDIPGHGPVQAGETWLFQGWFRDSNPGPTSNFTNASALAFP